MADDLALDWGARLKTRRVAAGLRQVDLGERAQVDKGFVSNIELGRTRPSDQVKIRLAAALSVRVEELFPYPDTSAAAAS